jgi:hypothetical protein
LKQAREDGYSVTEEEAKAYIASHPEELSDENLSSVAGGKRSPFTHEDILKSLQERRDNFICATEEAYQQRPYGFSKPSGFFKSR